MGRPKVIELTQEQGTKLWQWKEAKEQVDKAKEEEIALRQWCVANLGFDPDKLEGSQTLALAQGWKVVADKVMNYTATNEKGEILDVMNLLGSATGGNRPDLAQNLAKWKPELSVKTYREILPLTEGQQQIPGLKELLIKAVTIKPGLPQLELIPPKEETKVKESAEVTLSRIQYPDTTGQ